MNKALLLMICDFLLISVLALVEFDTPEEEQPPPPEQAPEIDEGMNADMVELLQLSLESEQSEREALAAEKESLEEQRKTLEEERADLAQNLEKREEDLALTQAERDRLAEERARLEREAAELAEERETLAAAKARTEAQLQETQAQRADLAENLESESEKARALQAELQNRLAALEAAESRVAQAQERAVALEQQTRELSTSLQIAETEKELLSENLKTARTDVEIARVERQRAEERARELAQGVSELAEQTEAVQEEMRRAQPISSNEIFSRYENNRLTLQFESTVPAFIGSREETTTVEAVLVRNGGRTFAVFEGSQGPFRLENLDRLRAVKGQLVLGSRRLEIVEISLLAADPRVVAVEVPARYLAETSLEPFELSEEPFRFPEAILISNQLGDYGETEFRLLPGGRRSISVNRSLMSNLRGEFQPSRGDYVFAQTGRLLGLMVEDERGILLNDFRPIAHLSLGAEFQPETADQLQQRFAPRQPR